MSLKYVILAAAIVTQAATPAPPAANDATRPFTRIQLHDQFWSEGANAGDLNRDGVKDIVAGPWWWEGPDFKKRHEYYPATTTFELKLGPMTTVTVPGFEGTLGKENKYSNNFFAWILDFNQDALRVLTDRLGRTQTASLQKELLNGISLIVNRR